MIDITLTMEDSLPPVTPEALTEQIANGEIRHAALIRPADASLTLAVHLRDGSIRNYRGDEALPVAALLLSANIPVVGL